MNKRVKPKWPWGLCFGFCQHRRVNTFSGLLISVIGLKCWRTADDSSSSRRWCACQCAAAYSVSASPNLIMARWHVSSDHLYKNILVRACPRVLFTAGTRSIGDLQHFPYMAKMQTELLAIISRTLSQINNACRSPRNSTITMHTSYRMWKNSVISSISWGWLSKILSTGGSLLKKTYSKPHCNPI